MLFQLFRSLLPFENPIGFGASDFLELFITAALACLVLTRPAIERVLRNLGKRTAWCMCLLAIAPVASRLLLLSNHPVPTPANYREFSALLAADTLRHFRLANPPHPLPQFFEASAVVERPTYSSTATLGEAIPLMLGRAVFGHPWAGVLVSVAALCSLSYWMLCAWTTPGWALAGGLLAVFECGPLNPWTNSYDGGAASAAAACLVFGSLPRIRASGRMRDAVLLGLGIVGCLLTFPYESVFLILTAAVFLIPARRYKEDRSRLARVAMVALPIVIAALLLIAFHDKAVTGSWTMSPAALSRVRGENAASIAPYLVRLEYHIRWYRFFLFAPLYLGVLAFIWTMRKFADLWLLLTVVMFALAANFETNLQLTSLAALAPLLLLLSIRGLQQLSLVQFRGRLLGRDAAHLIVFLCATQFLFWYGVHLFERHEPAAEIARYETWDSINHATMDRGAPITQQIASLPGRQVVFVRHSRGHNLQDEWVHNDADIDAARTVWARDLGPSENLKLQHYYSDRSVWIFDPEDNSPKLAPYAPETQPAIQPATAPPTTSVSPFETVH